MKPQVVPIVCLAQHSWESAWARPQQLMRRFAQRAVVLFVRPISIQHVITKPYERRRKLFRRDGENLYIYSPVVLPWGRRIAPIRWLNEFVIKRLVKRKIRKLRIENFALWIYAPVSEYLVGELGESIVVYDCTDAWSRFAGVPKYVITREERLSREADIIFAATGMLYDEKRHVNAKIHLLTCGVDYEHFNASAAMDDASSSPVESIPRPIIGYSGLIDRQRLDIELLGAVAREHPDWSLLLVGPVQDRECYVLRKYPNVHFTGLVAYADLPRYVRHFDVAVIPYSINDATRYINPTKLLEYMAAGKPVVSTNIPELRPDYRDKILLTENTEDFVAGIEAILDGTVEVPIEKNREHSLRYSWESVQVEMERLVAERI